MLLLALSLFFTEPAPLDMPCAEAYLVSEGRTRRLEDRYNRHDLWVAQAVLGRWFDADGRVFMLSRLDVCPPAIERDITVTRTDSAEQKVPMKRIRANEDFPIPFRDALTILAPCAVVEKPRPPKQLPRGYRNVCYWQNPTNYTSVVCTFRPEDSETWYLATWQLAEGDDYPMRMEQFEDQFLRREFGPFIETYVPAVPTCRPSRPTRERKRERLPSERELLRADAHQAVAAYREWHFTDAEEFTVLDDLSARGFVETLTNDFPVMRAKYAAALPTPLDGSNVLCVARVYATRGEYLDALNADGLTNMLWSAAYWSQQRRELVAYLPEKGEKELLKTIRHEALHQYLSYAAAMNPVSPWLNEGYAQHFEDEESDDWELGIEVTDEYLDRIAPAIPGLILMDYAQFYDGTDEERRFKYRIAWSVARFIEKGADEVRLKPFEGLKQRYMETLLGTGDMRRATSAAFKDADTLKKFVAEWKKFWKKK